LSNKTSISILGYGWLGRPLAIKLRDQGFVVKASTTTSDKLSDITEEGIQAFHINLKPETDNKLFEQFLISDILYINIPPGLRKDPDSDRYIKQIQFIGKCIKNSPVKKVILISTTSIYPDGNKEYFEDDILNAEQSGNPILFQAEQTVRNWNIDYCILRMGGLTGYDRNLLKYFEGKTNLTGGNTPVNLIHRDDSIAIIVQIIQNNQAWNQVFNCCSPLHPLRKEFYTHLANKFSGIAPQYLDHDATNWKKINSNKLINTLQYTYLFPNPLNYSYTR